MIWKPDKIEAQQATRFQDRFQSYGSPEGSPTIFVLLFNFVFVFIIFVFIFNLVIYIYNFCSCFALRILIDI